MILKPFDIEIPWFTDVLKAIGYPNALGLRTSQISSSECWNSEVSAVVPDGGRTASVAVVTMAFFVIWSSQNV